MSLLITSLNTFAQQVVTFENAIGLSLKQHPDLKSYVYMKQASVGMIEQAGISSPMALNVEVEDVVGTGRYSGISGMQTTLSISWLLEQSIIESRVNVANKQANIIEFKREVKALDVAAETAKIFITLLSQMEQVKLAKLAKVQSQKVLVKLAARVKAGKQNIIDELRAKADVSKKTLIVEDLEHEIEASKSQLAAQWQGENEFIVDGSLLDIPTIIEVEAAYEKLTSNPKFKVFTSQQRITTSEIELAKANQKPVWSVNTGIRRNEAVDDFAFTAGVSIPFGTKNINRGQIMALQAKQNQGFAETDAWLKRISTQLLLLTHKLKHNRHVIEGLSIETIPLLEQASIKAGEAYSIGSYRYSDWYIVQQELVASQKELIAAYTNIHLLNIELERLTGSSISM
ncbi:TolC family protein [Cognaticolwellia mytili]|uniref:TolC family protein n=1 Tax=Cognaticolwellia mytili TaxID=1888913 RepID=UPI001301FECF|nr:TolC family protein [Cognaticolwellia mytili]